MLIYVKQFDTNSVKLFDSITNFIVYIKKTNQIGNILQLIECQLPTYK